MKKYILILTFVFALTNVEAQNYSYGINSHLDSLHYAKFRSRMDSIRAERPTIAVVLSGGGAKGAAHIPVIRYLEKAGIPIDLIMGTSIGGLVGGLYACGYTGEDLEAIIRNQDWDNLLRDTHPRSYNDLIQKDYDRRFQLSIPYGTYKWDFRKPEISSRSILRDGIVHGRNIEDLLSSLLIGYGDEMDFINLPIPFVCVATDMITAKPKIWFSGSLVTAMRSTMSIPGLFTPVKKDGMVLMDGSMRSNFPAEIAKQLGADIIIGVDISAPALNADQFKSLIDIVYQTTDVLGREAYVKALKSTDIYIQPELSDFSLLSFDKESISTIIDRGRKAVEDKKEEIEELQQRLGNIHTRYSHNRERRKALNLRMKSVVVDSIRFNGINAKEERYLRKRLYRDKLKQRALHIVDLEDAVSTLMGTKAFEKVTYEILGDSAPYTLQYNLYRAPVNQLGVSARFDATDFASLLLHLGINAHQLTGSRLDLTARLGLNTVLTAGYTIKSGQGIDLGLELSFQAARNGSFRSEPYQFRIDFNRGRGEAFLSLMPWKRMIFRAGFRTDYYYWTSLLADYGLSGYNFDQLPKSNIFAGPYAQVRSDSFDDPYFPTQGVQYKLSYNWFPTGLQHATDPIHAAQLGYRSAHSAGKFTFIPFFDARYVSNAVLPYINMLSISDANKILDQQITFVGISTPESAMRTLGSAGLSIRRQFGKRNFVTASAQILHESENISDYFNIDAASTYYGFALEYAYNSIIGPVRANVHWSNFTNSVGFYFGLGLDF